MTKTTDHVRASLAAFRLDTGRDPSTIDDYREVAENAKRMAILEEAANKITPEGEEILVPTYFGVQEMEA